MHSISPIVHWASHTGVWPSTLSNITHRSMTFNPDWRHVRFVVGLVAAQFCLLVPSALPWKCSSHHCSALIFHLFLVVSWLRRLVIGLSPRRAGFDLSFHIRSTFIFHLSTTDAILPYKYKVSSNETLLHLYLSLRRATTLIIKKSSVFTRMVRAPPLTRCLANDRKLRKNRAVRVTVIHMSLSRVQLKCDGTQWRTGGEVKGKLANGVGSQYPSHYLGTWCIQHYYRRWAHLGCQ